MAGIAGRRSPPPSRVEVALDRPSLRWSGPGYLDSNEGDRPLEADFAEWDWCRAPMRDGAAILYNATRLVGGEQSLALRVGPGGDVTAFDPPPRAALPNTLWRLPRRTRSDPGHTPVLRQTLTDAPFYARSVIETRLHGETVEGVHESLSLDRFRAPWVQADAAIPHPTENGTSREGIRIAERCSGGPAKCAPVLLSAARGARIFSLWHRSSLVSRASKRRATDYVAPSQQNWPTQIHRRSAKPPTDY